MFRCISLSNRCWCCASVACALSVDDCRAPKWKTFSLNGLVGKRKSSRCETKSANAYGAHLGPNFHSRMKTFRVGGPGKLRVISDFDQTLTTYIGSDGHVGDECHGLILQRLHTQEVPGLDKTDWPHLKEMVRLYAAGEYSKLNEYYQKYNVPQDGGAWWFNTYQQISADFHLYRYVRPCISKSNTKIRLGLPETFALLQAHEIPLLVVSAGLRQVLDGIFEARGCPLPACADVVTNDMRLTTVTVSHLTKSASLAFTPEKHARAVSNRTSVLLLGDKPTDLAPLEGLNSDCDILTVCFFPTGLRERREPTPAEIDERLQQFDVVLIGDASMDFVNRILRSVLHDDADALVL